MPQPCAMLPVIWPVHLVAATHPTHTIQSWDFFSPSVITFLLDTKPSPTSPVNNSGPVTADLPADRARFQTSTPGLSLHSRSVWTSKHYDACERPGLSRSSKKPWTFGHTAKVFACGVMGVFGCVSAWMWPCECTLVRKRGAVSVLKAPEHEAMHLNGSKCWGQLDLCPLGQPEPAATVWRHPSVV